MGKSLVSKLFSKHSIREYGYVLEVNRVNHFVKVLARNGLRVKMDTVVNIKTLNAGDKVIYGLVSESPVILDKVVSAGSLGQLLLLGELVDPGFHWVADDIVTVNGSSCDGDATCEDQIQGEILAFNDKDATDDWPVTETSLNGHVVMKKAEPGYLQLYLEPTYQANFKKQTIIVVYKAKES